MLFLSGVTSALFIISQLFQFVKYFFKFFSNYFFAARCRSFELQLLYYITLSSACQVLFSKTFFQSSLTQAPGSVKRLCLAFRSSLSTSRVLASLRQLFYYITFFLLCQVKKKCELKCFFMHIYQCHVYMSS